MGTCNTRTRKIMSVLESMGVLEKRTTQMHAIHDLTSTSITVIERWHHAVVYFKAWAGRRPLSKQQRLPVRRNPQDGLGWKVLSSSKAMCRNGR